MRSCLGSHKYVWPCTLGLLLVLLFGVALSENPKKFQILTFNDIYNVQPENEQGMGIFNGKDHRFVKPARLGGVYNLADYLEQLRSAATREEGYVGTMTTLNGDFLGPSVISSVFTYGKHMVDIFNAMGVDLAVFGNHEFDTGAALALKMMQQSNFLWLAANARDATDATEDFNGDHDSLPLLGSDIPYVGYIQGLPMHDFPFHDVAKHARELPRNEKLYSEDDSGYNREIWEAMYDDVRVCAFGVVTKSATEAPNNNKTAADPLNPPGNQYVKASINNNLEKNRISTDTHVWRGNSKQVYFQEPVHIAKRLIRKLRNRTDRKCNIVVALTHLDLDQDEEIARYTCDDCVVKRGADIILGGHEHMPIVSEPRREVPRKALIWKSGCDGHFVGRIDVTLGDEGLVENLEYSMIPVREQPHRWFQRTLSKQGISHYQPWAETPRFVKQISEAYLDLTSPFTKIKLGKWAGTYDTATIRQQETAVSHFLANAIISMAKTDVAMLQSGTIRDARFLEDGIDDFTYMDIMAEMPFMDKITILTISEHSLYHAIKALVMRRNTGMFPSIVGLRVTFRQDGTLEDVVYESGKKLDPNNHDKMLRMSCPQYLSHELEDSVSEFRVHEREYLVHNSCETRSPPLEHICTHPEVAKHYWLNEIRGTYDASKWVSENIICTDCPIVDPPDD